MATSGSVDFKLNRNEIVKRAFKKLGILAEGETLTAEQEEDGAEDLNLMFKAWQAQGLHLWTYKEAELFLEKNKSKYLLGPTGDNASCESDVVKTTLSANETAGSTTLDLTDIVTLATNDNVGIVLDDGTIQWTTFSLYATSAFFTEGFDSSTGFTFDTTKSEITGGLLQQKDTRPTDATFGATYTSVIDGSWGGGTLTGTGTGSPTITGNKLDLSGGTNKYVSYDANLNADSQQVGTIKFKLTPDYTGFPAATQTLFVITEADANNDNEIAVEQVTGGAINVRLRNETGSLLSYTNQGSFNAISGNTYEFELNWDLTTGATRLFIDGVQKGSTITTTGTRDANIGLLRIGAALSGTGSPDFLMEDLVVFSTVQHTANYTPGYTLNDTIYLEDLITLPAFTYSGTGDIKQFTAFATTQTGSQKYNIDGQYHNGTSWVTSDDSLAQMNTVAEINTNIATLGAKDTLTLKTRWSVASNTQESVNTLTLSYGIGDKIVIAAGLTSAAASGNRVFSYTSKLERPLKITQARHTDTSSTDIPMSILSRRGYFALPNKTSTGVPVQFYYSPVLNNGEMHIWPTPDTSKNTIRFTYQRNIEDVDAETNDLDFPQEWLEAVVYNLADRLSDEYGLDDNVKARIQARAVASLDLALSFDQESGSIYISPDVEGGGVDVGDYND